MKKIAYILFFLFISAPLAATNDFQSDQNFPRFISNYYLNPQPDEIVSSWDYYVNSQYINANSTMMVAYYAAVLREHPTILKTLFDDHLNNNSAKAQLFMLRILVEINTPQSTEYLIKAQQEWQAESVQDALKKIKTSKPYDVLADVPRNTEDLDRLWGIFWATGNKTAISQIISVLSLWEQGRGAAVAIGGAAMWSLTKHANQHPTILQIVIAERDNSSGTQKNLLEKIINNAERN